MSEADHGHFMGLALAEGRKNELEGNVPIGSVTARDGEVNGSGHNEATLVPDATAHAEVQAIRDACRKEGALHPGRIPQGVPKSRGGSGMYEVTYAIVGRSVQVEVR